MTQPLTWSQAFSNRWRLIKQSKGCAKALRFLMQAVVFALFLAPHVLAVWGV